MKLLITGGAGYIGSHMVKYAQENGYDIVVLDDFSTGHEWAIDGCEVVRINLLDKNELYRLLNNRHFDGVIHFAAKSVVGESVKKPEMYYQNNVVGSLNLINWMIDNGTNNLVFSSSAAIFGNPKTERINENHPKNPINPYGKSKLIIENIFRDISSIHNINISCLRYFNAAGAHKSGLIGEDHFPETHLIPNIIRASITGDTFKIFGNDYDTRDGTCIRDYIHVDDLSYAHLLALNYIKKNPGFFEFNLGNGNGYSILEVFQSCKKYCKKRIKYEVEGRREGDPGSLVADSTKAMNLLGWRPRNNSIELIIESAYKWHEKQLKI